MNILKCQKFMPKQITIEIPGWIDENYVTELVKKLVEVEMRRREVIEKVIKKRLTEKDLEDFERFRDDLWKKEAKKFFSL